MAFIQVPFADGGDKIAIPIAEPPDGSVSFDSGFGPNYELPQGDAAALDVPRAPTNELFNIITTAIQQYQIFSVPDFITTLENGGIAFPYSKYARVRYDDGVNGPRVFESLVNTNSDLPTVPASWRWVDNVTDTSALIYNNATFEATVADDDAVYWDSGTSKFTKALADGSITQDVIGFADVTNSRVFMAGLCKQFTGLTPNALYYLSPTTPGAITTIPPLNYSVQLGIALNATNMVINVTFNSASSGGIPVGARVNYDGFIVPAGFLIGDGSAVSRTTYANLFKVYSSLQNGVLTNGSAIVTGLTSTSKFRIGMAVTGTGVPGSTTIASVDSATQVTLSATATVSATNLLCFYLHGAGDGSTTFNVPDTRRRVSVGEGGTGTAVLGNTVGATGGEEAHTMTLDELVPHKHSFTSYTTADGDDKPRSAQAPDDPHVNDTTETGNGIPFNIMQSSFVATQIIKY